MCSSAHRVPRGHQSARHPPTAFPPRHRSPLPVRAGIRVIMGNKLVYYSYSVGIMLFTFVFSAFVAEGAHVPVEPVIVPEEEVLGVAPGEALRAHHAARHPPPLRVIPALENTAH